MSFLGAQDNSKYLRETIEFSGKLRALSYNTAQ